MAELSSCRRDFPMCGGRMMNGKPLVYLDNAATTFKPNCVREAVDRYYAEDTTNVERGDYELSARVSVAFEQVREKVASFINCDPAEIVYTSGATDSLNLVAEGYGGKFLKPGDVILTTIAEHASNILPWFRIAKRTGAVVRFIPLTPEGRVTAENVRKALDEKVRIVAIAQVHNVLGYLVPIKEIAGLAHAAGAVIAVDGAQSVPHLKTDVRDLDIDFLSFSSHKMCGPSGAGILYGRQELLDKLDPSRLGGGSNARFGSDGSLILRDVPFKFEAGTPAIEGILGLGAAIDYLQGLGMVNIRRYEQELRKHLMGRLGSLDNLDIYNPDAEGGIVTFNVKGVFPQDAASYLASQGIAVRSGLHCAKMLPELLKVPGTVRCSLYFYNTFADCDKLAEALKTCTVANSVGIFF